MSSKPCSPDPYCHYLFSLLSWKDCHSQATHMWHSTQEQNSPARSSYELNVKIKIFCKWRINKWLVDENELNQKKKKKSERDLYLHHSFLLSLPVHWSSMYLLLPSCALEAYINQIPQGPAQTKCKLLLIHSAGSLGCASPSLLIFFRRVRTSFKLWKKYSERRWHRLGCPPLPKYFIFL